MEHKYSTFILLFVLGMIGLTMLANGIEGFGTKGTLARFDGSDMLVNSSISEDNSSVNISLPVFIDGSQVCTDANGLCGTVRTNGTLIRVLNGSVGDGTFVEWII